ncbi:hypothetical protein GFL21_15240 [Rhizobium anhuiense]|uniref:hypothetical protein n=1 Tax=Rhizobium anhuiense TaxID=1184720 RepID=UPI00144243F1|nr:hypothetical protein [Rhizobium anhuiense]NKM55865.1 hypothetical protein [Rhizobium anhuiense]
MISISTLRASRIQALRYALAAGEQLDEFAAATASFLKNTPVDGGADSDLIATIGHRLSLAEVWMVAPIDKLVAAWKEVPLPAVRLFLEDAPNAFAEQIVERLQGKAQSAKPKGHSDRLGPRKASFHVSTGPSGNVRAKRRLSKEEFARQVAGLGLSVSAFGIDPTSISDTGAKKLMKSSRERRIERFLAKLVREDDDNKPTKFGRHRYHAKSR